MPRFPTTIPRLVMAVVVNAPNCESFRRVPHVRKEVGELHPSLANRDASTAIPFVVPSLGIDAPLNHVVPNGVNLGLIPAPSLAVLYSGPDSFQVKATAGLGVVLGQRIVSDPDNATALADTKRHSYGTAYGVSDAASVSQNFKPSKRATDEGYFRGHNDVLSIVLLSGGRPARTGARCDSSKPA